MKGFSCRVKRDREAAAARLTPETRKSIADRPRLDEELERVRQGLDNISLCMTNQHSALERLMQTAKNSPAGKE